MPLHYLILDTCVWVDLAVSEFSLVSKLARLVEDGKASIIIPELIQTEWDGCKKTIEMQISNEVVEARKFAKKFFLLMDEVESNDNDASTQVASADPKSIGQRIAAQRIAAVEAILNSKATTYVPVSKQAETLAIKHALEKKAPFRTRNSMADALIFLSAVEWVDDQKPDNVVFVTHNTKDFSDKKRDKDDSTFNERLAPDLLSLVESNGMSFEPVIGRVLNDVEQSVATEEEVKRGESVVARTRLRDELARLGLGGAAAEMMEQQKIIDELVHLRLGGAAAEMMEQQKKIEQMLKLF